MVRCRQVLQVIHTQTFAQLSLLEGLKQMIGHLRVALGSLPGVAHTGQISGQTDLPLFKVDGEGLFLTGRKLSGYMRGDADNRSGKTESRQNPGPNRPADMRVLLVPGASFSGLLEMDRIQVAVGKTRSRRALREAWRRPTKSETVLSLLDLHGFRLISECGMEQDSQGSRLPICESKPFL